MPRNGPRVPGSSTRRPPSSGGLNAGFGLGLVQRLATQTYRDGIAIRVQGTGVNASTADYWTHLYTKRDVFLPKVEVASSNLVSRFHPLAVHTL